MHQRSRYAARVKCMLHPRRPHDREHHATHVSSHWTARSTPQTVHRAPRTSAAAVLDHLLFHFAAMCPPHVVV
eukprot:10420396-Alexandrium_andersonii.AAC.1